MKCWLTLPSSGRAFGTPLKSNVRQPVTTTELWQLSLVVAGGLIGICGALLSSLLTSLLSERRLRREKRERLQELVGRRQAILELADQRTGPSSTEEVKSWLEQSSPASATVAFMIGYLEKNTEQTEVAISETLRLRQERELAQAKILSLSEEQARLVGERDRLLTEHTRLVEAYRTTGAKIARAK